MMKHLVAFMFLAHIHISAQTQGMMIRLSEIEIDSSYSHRKVVMKKQTIFS